MHPHLLEWTDWMRAGGASDDTIRTRTVCIGLLCKSAATTDPVSITTRQVVHWLAGCRSGWTRYTYATSAKMWHRWLVDLGYRTDNPMDKVPVPPAPKSTARPAPGDAIHKVLEVAGPRARVYIKLATYQGLRVHEIAKVTGEGFVDGWYYVRGKGDTLYPLPIHPMVDQLRRGFPTEGFWFPGRFGTDHVTADTVSQVIARAFHQAGYHITAHQLRHWFGTHAQRVGKDTRVTQQLMRHANLRNTQIYTEVADLAMVETVRRLAV